MRARCARRGHRRRLVHRRVGPGNPGQSWAVVLARLLHWDAVVYGVPGAGYVRAGVGRMGPVAAEIARLDLRVLTPTLAIVQAGHDDIRVPPRLEQRRVEQAVALIHAEAPRARIALLTVFARHVRSPVARRTHGAPARQELSGIQLAAHISKHQAGQALGGPGRNVG